MQRSIVRFVTRSDMLSGQNQLVLQCLADRLFRYGHLLDE